MQITFIEGYAKIKTDFFLKKTSCDEPTGRIGKRNVGDRFEILFKLFNYVFEMIALIPVPYGFEFFQGYFGLSFGNALLAAEDMIISIHVE